MLCLVLYLMRKGLSLKSPGSERGKWNKKTGSDALKLISVSEPGFSMVFPMNNWAGFSLKLLI